MMRQRCCVLSAAALLSLMVCACPATLRAGTPPASASPRSPTFEQVKRWVEAYKAAHSGHGGRDWDINSKSPAEIADEPDTKRLLSICGPDQRPVFPSLAWEYGGSDHRWKDPDASALVYCVYTPVERPSSHWRFDAARNRVVADVYVKFPDHNPCRNRKGKDQVMGCIGDDSNLEILVDTASLNDGRDAGLKLSEASTELKLILANGKKVPLVVVK